MNSELEVIKDFKKKLEELKKFEGKKIYLGLSVIDDNNFGLIVYFDNSDGRMIPEYLVKEKGNENAKKLCDVVKEQIGIQQKAVVGNGTLSGSYDTIDAYIRLDFSLSEVSRALGLRYLNKEQRDNKKTQIQDDEHVIRIK